MDMCDKKLQVSANDREETDRQLTFIGKANEYVKKIENQISRKHKQIYYKLPKRLLKRSRGL